MSLLSALLVAGAVGWGSAHRGGNGWRWGAGAAVLAFAPPIGIAAVGSRWALRRLGARSAARRRAVAAQREVDELARFVLIGVSAGWSLVEAIRQAAPHLRSDLGDDVGELLRAARTGGMASALAAHRGPGSSFYGVLARAQASGAPLRRAIGAFVRDRASARQAAAIESARKLPVRMVVPLTLLMLPGFVLLVAGPAVVLSGRRLLGPLLG